MLTPLITSCPWRVCRRSVSLYFRLSFAECRLAKADGSRDGRGEVAPCRNSGQFRHFETRVMLKVDSAGVTLMGEPVDRPCDEVGPPGFQTVPS